jgi:hypothetical protein
MTIGKGKRPRDPNQLAKKGRARRARYVSNDEATITYAQDLAKLQKWLLSRKPVKVTSVLALLHE